MTIDGTNGINTAAATARTGGGGQASETGGAGRKAEPVTSQTNENSLTSVSSEDKSKTIFDKLLENGTLKQNKTFFGLLNTGSYTYICDGTKTLGEIRAELGLAQGVISKRNKDYVDKISGSLDTSKDRYLDDFVPAKGTELNLSDTDFPTQDVSFKDNDGNEITGFKKAIDGTLYYIVQSGDTISDLKARFKTDSLKGYDMSATISSLQESEGQTWQNKDAGILAVGTKAIVPEKPWWKFW